MNVVHSMSGVIHVGARGGELPAARVCGSLARLHGWPAGGAGRPYPGRRIIGAVADKRNVMMVHSEAARPESSPGATPWISLRGVGLKRGRRWIFDRVDLEVPRGSVTAIMGPSGSGKTTLLRLISGQLQPSRGQVMLDGQDTARFRRADWQAMRRRVGGLFKGGAVFAVRSVLVHVAL